jgi:soluble lytic murein transglycosylase-like protein
MRRERPRACARDHLGEDRGQALVLLVGLLCLVLAGAAALGAFARALGEHGARLGVADLAALAGAAALREAYPRVFTPAVIDGVPNADHLERPAYLALGRRAALATARRNGAVRVRVDFPDTSALAPTRIAVTVLDAVRVADREAPSSARAVAALSPEVQVTAGASLAGTYSGRLATRQGQSMRPDVAAAFDRMAAAAASKGVALLITSAFRDDAEQARLFARHPDPRWVAPPGRSLHRLGTELDLGPAAAYGWLARNAERFGFVQRYSWEAWHYGYTRAAGSRSVGYGPPDGRSGLPSFVPAQWAPAISRAAQRWNVGAALLAAQLFQESRFNPFAVSRSGARGLAQFMPDTARQYGLTDPFDGAAAIMAQAHLMHDLLAQLGSVPLALAAYNAGPEAVRRYGGIPPFAETQGYVAEILALLGGAGDASAGMGRLTVRLVA